MNTREKLKGINRVDEKGDEKGFNKRRFTGDVTPETPQQSATEIKVKRPLKL